MLISIFFIFHNPISKVGIPQLTLFMFCFMLKLFCLHMYVCVCVEYVWEGLKQVFLNGFPLYFPLFFLKGLYECIGITHPQIGKKWPCIGGGLQLDSNSVESLFRMRRGKEGKVLWAPTRQHKPCFEFWNLRNGRIEILKFIALKGTSYGVMTNVFYQKNSPSPQSGSMTNLLCKPRWV